MKKDLWSVYMMVDTIRQSPWWQPDTLHGNTAVTPLQLDFLSFFTQIEIFSKFSLFGQVDLPLVARGLIVNPSGQVFSYWMYMFLCLYPQLIQTYIYIQGPATSDSEEEDMDSEEEDSEEEDCDYEPLKKKKKVSIHHFFNKKILE